MTQTDALVDVVEAMADAVIVSDAGGRILYANSQAELLSGYSSKELLGRQMETLLPARLRAGHKAHRAHYVAAPARRGMGTDLNIRLRRHDGSEVPVDIALSPLGSGDALRVIAVIRDDTRRRETERALRDQAQVLELANDAILVRTYPDGRITFWNQGAADTYGYSRKEAVGSASHQLLKTTFPTSLHAIDKAVLEAGAWEGELGHTRKDGGRLLVSSRWVLLRGDSGKPNAIFEINRDITEPSRARERLDAVLQVTQAILSRQETEAVLGLIAHRARELVGAALATIALPEGHGDMYVIQAAEGSNAEKLLGMQIPADNSLIGRTMGIGKPTLVADLRTEPGAFPDFVEASEMGPALFVPLLVEGYATGALTVANPPGSPPFSSQEVQTLAELFAATAAFAVEYSRAREASRRVAVLEDRERIARELHDGAIQALFAVGMSLQGAALRTAEEPVAQRLHENVTKIDEVIRDLRSYIFQLRPAILDERSLGPALRDLAQSFERDSGVVTVVDVDGQAAGQLETRSQDVLQLATEALSNVRRHANATTCRISLEADADRAVLTVDDDGQGFDVGHTDGLGQGLRNLRERAEGLGGELEIESVAGQGTTVKIAIPT